MGGRLERVLPAVHPEQRGIEERQDPAGPLRGRRSAVLRRARRPARVHTSTARARRAPAVRAASVSVSTSPAAMRRKRAPRPAAATTESRRRRRARAPRSSSPATAYVTRSMPCWSRPRMPYRRDTPCRRPPGWSRPRPRRRPPGRPRRPRRSPPRRPSRARAARLAPAVRSASGHQEVDRGLGVPLAVPSQVHAAAPALAMPAGIDEEDAVAAVGEHGGLVEHVGPGGSGPVQHGDGRTVVRRHPPGGELDPVGGPQRGVLEGQAQVGGRPVAQRRVAGVARGDALAHRPGREVGGDQQQRDREHPPASAGTGQEPPGGRTGHARGRRPARRHRRRRSRRCPRWSGAAPPGRDPSTPRPRRPRTSPRARRVARCAGRASRSDPRSDSGRRDRGQRPCTVRTWRRAPAAAPRRRRRRGRPGRPSSGSSR